MGSRRKISHSNAPAVRTDGPPVEPEPELRTIQVLYHAPIPVGHRVEVQFFKESPEGPSAPDAKILVESPIVTDLDSGVSYSALSHYDQTGHLREWLEVPFPERLQPRPHVYFAERITGRVTACRVISDARAPTKLEVMTQLRVELELSDER